MKTASEANCQFCQSVKGSQVVVEYGSVFAILDKHPVTKGHLLVITKRHLGDYFDMSYNEKRDAEAFLSLLKRQILEDDPSVKGFNVGMNCGEVAGQTVEVEMEEVVFDGAPAAEEDV